MLLLFDALVIRALTRHGWPLKHYVGAPGGGWTSETIPTTTTDLVALSALIMLHVIVGWRLMMSCRNQD